MTSRRCLAGWGRDLDAVHVCYIVQSDRGGAFKVGNAKCMSKRLKALQQANPEPLIVRALLRGGTDTERAYHAALGDYRGTGEWFEPSGVPLLCTLLRDEQRLIWGGPWSAEPYREPPPTAAFFRARCRQMLLDALPTLLDTATKTKLSSRQRTQVLGMLESLTPRPPFISMADMWTDLSATPKELS